MRGIVCLIRLGVVSMAAFAATAACGSSDDGGGAGGAGGSSGSSGSGGTSGTSGTGGSGGDAGPDGGGPCKDGDVVACYTGPASTQGIGACKDGTSTCIAGEYGPCTGDVLPSTEVCDTEDNNCNGTADEGCACTEGTERPCYSGPDNTVNTGICKEGIQKCVGGTWSATCDGEVTPKTETCNATDDNCDGLVDDGNPGGGGPCVTGQPGECSAGTQKCSNGSLICEQTNQPGSEVCDAKDNNCNGQTDEGNPGGGGTCSTGQLGVCANGTHACVGGAIQCQQGQFPSGEICDAKDNDCDGQTDEGNPGGGGACNTGKLGVCNAGTLACSNGSVVCNQNVQPSGEDCDGLDNNCNGQIDEFACCPYVFCDDGSGFVYESTIGGGGLVSKAEHVDPKSPGRRIEFRPMHVRLDRAAITSGRLRTEILVAEDEIVYLDEASLTLVEHPEGHEVLARSSRAWRPDSDAEPELVALRSAALRPPAHATWRGEVDVTEAISRLDERAVFQEPQRGGYYELDFGALHAPNAARLVIEGWKLKLDARRIHGAPRHQPYLEVEQADGSFRRALELSPPRGDRKALCFDLSSVAWPSGRYRMRLWIGTGDENGVWFVDRVRLTEEAPAPIRTRRIPVSRATLAFHGAPTLLTAGDPTRPRLARDDGRGELTSEQRTFGAFTRYGDVTPLLEHANDMFVIMRRGDAVELVFEGLPEPASGHTHTALLHTDLVFKPRRLPGTSPSARSENVEPLPFHGMQHYGAAMQGSYPDDAEHRRYRAEWNTRVHTPSDEHWGEPAQALCRARRHMRHSPVHGEGGGGADRRARARRAVRRGLQLGRSFGRERRGCGRAV